MSDAPPSSPDSPPPRTTGGNFRWEPPTAAELQALMPGYTIEKLLGRGGMGAVYKGVQENLDRTVAIKILPPGIEKEDPSFAERFKNEAKLMAKLNHPAIVTVYDFGKTTSGQFYFAMEYADGTDVAQMIRTQGRLPPEHALAITAHVCDALAAAHELGIVHRDIKPANVLINMKGQVKVADFGLAKIEEPGQHGLTKTGYAMGTPDFVAPEVLMLGTHIDGRADLYAVGVMLYQMLTGEVPRGAFKPASVHIPGLDRRYDPIIMKAMQSDREERYQSSAELRCDLDVILTVPLIKQDEPASAAIPVAQVAQVPAQRSAAQKPGRSHVRQNVDERPQAHAPLAQPTSNAPLFIGLAVTAVIAIGAFVMFSGKSDVARLSKVESAPPPTPKPSALAAQPRRESQATANPPPQPSPPKVAPTKPASPAPATIATTASPLPSLPPPVPKQWIDATKLVRATAGPVQAEDVPGGWRATDLIAVITVSATKPRNAVLRVRYRDGSIATTLRTTNSQGQYAGHINSTGQTSLEFLDFAAVSQGNKGTIRMVQGTSLAGFKREEPHESVFAAQGDELSLWIDGQLVARTKDARLTAGQTRLRVEKGTIIEKVEYAELPDETEVAASPTPSVSKPPPPPASPSSPQFPPGQWVKVFTKAEDLPADLRKPDSGVKFEDGWIRFEKGIAKLIPLPSVLTGNYGVRVHAIRSGASGSGDKGSGIVLRDNAGGHYQFKLSGGILNCERAVGVQYPAIYLVRPPSVPAPGQEYRIEFATVGERLIGRLDSTFVKVATDAQWKQGSSYLGFGEDIRDIEVINLDGMPEAEALKILGVDEKGNDTRAAALAAEKQAMEQAKVVDAASAIPELKTLHEQFVKLTAERVTAPFVADVAKLNAGYVGGIDRKITEETAAGHLDGVIALEAEKKLVQGVGVANSPSSNRDLASPAPCPIPAEAAEGTTANLKALRAIYRTAYAKIEAARVANLKSLTDPLTLRLKQLETDLTKQKRVPDAKTVREYREKLTEESASASASHSNKDGEAVKKDAGKSSSIPVEGAKTRVKLVPDLSRKAAEHALKKGASVTLIVHGTTIKVMPGTDLPKGAWELQAIQFPMDANLEITDDDLRLMTEASELEIFEMDMRNKAAFTSLTPFAKTPMLRRLLIHSYGAVTAEDCAAIGGLSQLQTLVLPGAAPIADFKRLVGRMTITHISLGGRQLTAMEDYDVLGRLPLVSLDFKSISNDGLVRLGRLDALGNMGFVLTEIQPEAFAALSPKLAKSLKVLSFGAIYKDSSAAAKVAVEKFESLEDLSVRGAVSAEALPNIGKLRYLKTLSFLQGTCTPELIAAVSQCRMLVTFGIGKGNLTATDIAALAKMPRLSSLKFQDNGIQIDKAALEALPQLKDLKVLDLPESKVSGDEAEALRKKMPKCIISLVKQYG